MPQRVVRQPNGKLALFSSVVDHFLYYDCDAEELYQIMIEEYDYNRRAAMQKLMAGIDDWKPYTFGIKGTGRTRWNDDAFQALIVHGPENADLQKVLQASGMTAEEITEWNRLAQKARLELDTTGMTAINAPENEEN